MVGVGATVTVGCTVGVAVGRGSGVAVGDGVGGNEGVAVHSGSGGSCSWTAGDAGAVLTVAGAGSIVPS